MRKHRALEPGTNVGVRLQRDDLAELDAWIADTARARESTPMSRPMAIRHLMREALRARRPKKKKHSTDSLRDLED